MIEITDIIDNTINKLEEHPDKIQEIMNPEKEEIEEMNNMKLEKNLFVQEDGRIQ